MSTVNNSDSKASNIEARLPEGNTPMDIINGILERPLTKNIERPSDTQNTSSESSTSNKESIPARTEGDTGDVKPSTEVVTPEKRDGGSGESIVEEVEDDDKNLVKLRKAKTEAYKSLKDREEELATARKELEAWEKGEKLSPVVLEKESRIKELEKFQALHDLKSTQEYRKKVVEPLTNNRSALLKKATDYEVGNPDALVSAMVNERDPRKLNRLIEDHFDTLEGLEVKKLVQDTQSKIDYAKEVELEPAKHLEEMQAEAYESNRQAELNKVNLMTERSRSAWTRAHEKIVADGMATELIPREDDSEYNDKFVKPLMAKAATEFGQFVTRLTGKLKEPLDDEEMLYLSNMTQLAHSAAVAQQTRNNAVTTLEEVLANTTRKNGYLRPPVGSQMSRATAPTSTVIPGTDASREQTMDELLKAGRANARR